MNFQTLQKLDMRTGLYDETLVDLSRLIYMTERSEFFTFNYPHIKKENRIVTTLRLGDEISIFVEESADQIRGML
jgi:hypothetical protein